MAGKSNKAGQNQKAARAAADLDTARKAAKGSGESMERELFERIGRQVLNRETLETRRSDSLDFSENAVWQLKEALERAFEAGKLAGQKGGR